jgi:hypothetical protein
VALKQHASLKSFINELAIWETVAANVAQDLLGWRHDASSLLTVHKYSTNESWEQANLRCGHAFCLALCIEPCLQAGMTRAGKK